LAGYSGRKSSAQNLAFPVVIALLIDHTQVFQLVADAFRLDAFDNHFQIVAVGKVEPIIQGKEHAVFVGVSEIQQRNFDGMNILNIL
jgi:hypothetical protein